MPVIQAGTVSATDEVARPERGRELVRPQPTSFLKYNWEWPLSKPASDHRYKYFLRTGPF
jgi:hypothetical protein